MKLSDEAKMQRRLFKARGSKDLLQNMKNDVQEMKKDSPINFHDVLLEAIEKEMNRCG